jgi:hypothetical protein
MTLTPERAFGNHVMSLEADNVLHHTICWIDGSLLKKHCTLASCIWPVLVVGFCTITTRFPPV